MRIRVNANIYEGGLEGFSCSEKLGSKGSANLSLVMRNGDIPIQTGDRVTLEKDSGEVVFNGIVTIPKTDKRNSPYEPDKVSLSCSSLAGLLEKRIMNESYENKTASEIIELIYYSYLRQERILLGQIDTTPDITFVKYNAKNLSVYAVLNELASLSGGYWVIDQAGMFEFRVFNGLTRFPECPTVITEDNAYLGNLQSSLSDRDMRTVQVIEGSFMSRGVISSSLYTGEDWKFFQAKYPLENLQEIKLEFIVIGESITVDPAYIGEDTGADDFDPSAYMFVWERGSDRIQFNENFVPQYLTPVYANNAIVTATYDSRIPMRYESRNETAIDKVHARTGFSGVMENVVTDDTIVELADAEKRAEELLTQFGEQKRTIRFDVDPLQMDTKTQVYVIYWEVGTLFHFNLERYGVVGDFVLTEKTIKQGVRSDDDALLYTVTFTDRNYIDDYAKAIKQLQYDVMKLSVRETDVVIKNLSFTEGYGFGEEVNTENVMSILVAPNDYTGGLCYPLSDVYNVLTR